MCRQESVNADALRHLLRGYGEREAARLLEIGWLEQQLRLVDQERDPTWFKGLYDDCNLHRKVQGQLCLLRKLNAQCGDVDADGRRWHDVPYAKASLGRTFAKGVLVEDGLYDDADVPNDKSTWRSVSYQGMYSELRAPLGPHLRDLDMVKAFANILKNRGRHVDALDLIPTIAEYADRGDAFLQRVVAHHQLVDASTPSNAEAAKAAEDAAKAVAKTLVTAMLCFGSYRAWQKANGRTADAQMEEVAHLREEALLLKEKLFADTKHAARVNQERDALKRDRPRDSAIQIERSLWSRFMQEDENTILELIDDHLRRKLGDRAVVSLVFDGLMVQGVADEDVQPLIDEVERELATHHDWHIKIVEKPNFGQPFALPRTLVASNGKLQPYSDAQLEDKVDNAFDGLLTGGREECTLDELCKHMEGDAQFRASGREAVERALGVLETYNAIMYREGRIHLI
jgi:hypothetical protein